MENIKAEVEAGGGDIAGQQLSAPDAVRDARQHGIVAAMCVAILTVLMYTPSFGLLVLPLFCVALLYAACAWSQLAFAMKLRFDWILGLPVFIIVLFPLWYYLFCINIMLYLIQRVLAWLYVMLSSLAVEFEQPLPEISLPEPVIDRDLERFFALGALALPLLFGIAMLLVLGISIVISLRRRARSNAPAGKHEPDPARIDRLCLQCRCGAAAVAILSACLSVIWCTRVDLEKAGISRYIVLFFGFNSVCLPFLAWLLYIWNDLMLEVNRSPIFRFGLNLLVLILAIFVRPYPIIWASPIWFICLALVPIVIDTFYCTRPINGPAVGASRVAELRR